MSLTRRAPEIAGSFWVFVGVIAGAGVLFLIIVTVVWSMIRRSRRRARLTRREGIRTELPVRHPAPFTPGPPHRPQVSSDRPSGGPLPTQQQQKQHSRQFSSSTRGAALPASAAASGPHAPIPSRRQRLEDEDEEEEEDWGEGDAFNADTEYGAGYRQPRQPRREQQRGYDYQPRQQQQQQYPHTQAQWQPDPNASYPQAHLYEEPEPLAEQPQREYSEDVWSATGDQDNAGYGLPTYDSLPPPGEPHAQYPPVPAAAEGGATLGPRASMRKGPLPG